MASRANPARASTPARRYHHGSLDAALVDAGLALATAGGSAAVTVREAARRVGVSAPAAYRHFEDRDHLLAEVSQRCREQLALAMIEARDRHRSPYHRIMATGRAYIEFATANPGLIDCAFAAPPTPRPDEPDAYAVLADGLDDLAAHGLLPSDRRAGAEIVAWTSVHGAAMLLTRSPALATDADEVIDRVLRGVRDALAITQRQDLRTAR